MSYIGNTPQNQGFAPAVDYFNGDGTTVTFTLSRPVASVAQLTAVIENVIQNPTSAFTVSGNQLTFTSAPPAGTNNIWVEYTSLITQYNGISQDPSVVGDITASGGYLSTGDFGNSYLDGTIVDYVTGMSRITTGPSDGVTIYNGGTSARSALMTISSAGNVGIGTTSPTVYGSYKTLEVRGTGGGLLQIGTGATTAAYLFQDGTNSGFNNISNGVMTFGTNNTERMRIDTSGRVTTPYQPSFRAYSTAGAYSTTGVDIAFPNTTFNIGSYYSTSNGRFTAPVAGIYLFLWSTSSFGATGFSLDLHKNGSTLSFSEQNNSLNYFVTGQSQLVSLAVGDYVTWRLRFGTINLADPSTNVQGFLVG